jgi:hypothetical protein
MPLLLKLSSVALPVLALLWFFLSDSLRPTVERPPTRVEQQQTTAAMTQWSSAFKQHK